MPIPKYQQTILPLLKLLSDGKRYTNQEIHENLSIHFKIYEEEKEITQTNETQSLFQKRLGWGKYFLERAGLIEVKNQETLITQLGRDLLKQNPEELNKEFLMSIPQFTTAVGKTKSMENQGLESIMANSFFEIRKKMEGKILETLRETSSYHFEKGIKEMLGKMGYKIGEVTSWGGDGGITGIIFDDELGINEVFLVVKRCNKIVPDKEINAFTDSIGEKELTKGIFITTSDFSKEQKKFVDSLYYKITLLNGEDLAGFMYDYGVGFKTLNSYDIKKLDKNYFSN